MPTVGESPAPAPIAGKCPVCGDALASDIRHCERCDAPHHPACWDWVGGCSIYGCQERTAPVAPESGSLPVAPPDRLMGHGPPIGLIPFPAFFWALMGAAYLLYALARWSISSLHVNGWLPQVLAFITAAVLFVATMRLATVRWRLSPQDGCLYRWIGPEWFRVQLERIPFDTITRVEVQHDLHRPALVAHTIDGGAHHLPSVNQPNGGGDVDAVARGVQGHTRLSVTRHLATDAPSAEKRYARLQDVARQGDGATVLLLVHSTIVPILSVLALAWLNPTEAAVCALAYAIFGCKGEQFLAILEGAPAPQLRAARDEPPASRPLDLAELADLEKQLLFAYPSGWTLRGRIAMIWLLGLMLLVVAHLQVETTATVYCCIALLCMWLSARRSRRLHRRLLASAGICLDRDVRMSPRGHRVRHQSVQA